MTQSKAWDWSKNKSDIWEIPSEESFYLNDRWNKKGYKTLLDLGCGLGRHSLYFSKYGFDTYSIDLSEEAIRKLNELANEKNLNVITNIGDMVSLPYNNEFFDCLFAYNVISHTDTEGIKLIAKEIERVIKPGGELFLTLCSKDTWSYRKAGYPILDENSVMKIEDGPENGVPHFFADTEIIKELFKGFRFEYIKHIQEVILKDKEYGSWHYHILGIKK